MTYSSRMRCLSQVEKRLAEEERRVQILLHNHSSDKLMPVCEKVKCSSCCARARA